MSCSKKKNRSMNKLLLTVLSFVFINTLKAQDNPEMADLLRSNGKIYTVVAVCLTILLGLFFYTFLVDRKISRLEKEIQDNKQ